VCVSGDCLESAPPLNVSLDYFEALLQRNASADDSRHTYPEISPRLADTNVLAAPDDHLAPRFERRAAGDIRSAPGHIAHTGKNIEAFRRTVHAGFIGEVRPAMRRDS
jgi:hypothetical protein